MLPRPELIRIVRELGIEALDLRADKKLGVGGQVLRGVLDRQRTVVVGSNQVTQIGAVMDLVHLHLNGAQVPSGQPVDPHEVTLVFLEDDRPNPETEDALRTLAASAVSGPWVRLKALSPNTRQLRDVPVQALDFRDATTYRYEKWIGDLAAIDAPPAVLRDLVSRVGVPALRAYPMQANRGGWSLRLDGLIVGTFKGDRGTLDVGKVGKLGALGPEKTAWLAVAGPAPLKVTVGDELSLAHAADVLKRYAAALLPELVAGTEAAHDEHALESRILRGLVPLATSDGTPLELLRGRDDLVNWGSQFPTRWGRSQGPAARYLDAMLHDGETPWAVEIKIQSPALGITSYYRHAVAQAVLYRQFIRTASPLRQWFTNQNLNQRLCRAAVVVPEFLPADTARYDHLAALCAAFDVELICVPRRFAGLSNVDQR